MAGEVQVPTLGESIAEATVGAWLKRVGDAVEAGEPLVPDPVSRNSVARKCGAVDEQHAVTPPREQQGCRRTCAARTDDDCVVHGSSHPWGRGGRRPGS